MSSSPTPTPYLPRLQLYLASAQSQTEKRGRQLPHSHHELLQLLFGQLGNVGALDLVE